MSKDPASAALDVLSDCDRYTEWLYDLVRPHLGSVVIEVGAGRGTQSSLLVQDSSERQICLTDADAQKVDLLRERFDNAPGVTFAKWRLPDHVPPGLPDPDTIVLWNVLEHVEDDVAALRSMRDSLTPGGRVIVFSPAGRDLMSDLDRKLGHVRRYGRHQLADTARRAGLKPICNRAVNMVGAIGWLVSARFGGGRRLSAMSARVFDHLVPLLRLWEDRLPVPWGLSMLVVAAR